MSNLSQGSLSQGGKQEIEIEQYQLGLCDMMIYRMDEIKSLSFHIMFYRLYCGVAKYIVSGNTFSSFISAV